MCSSWRRIRSGVSALDHILDCLAELLEPVQKDWWTLHESRPASAAGGQQSLQASTEAGGSSADPGTADRAAEGGPQQQGVWQPQSTQGKGPVPRYEHAVAAMEGSMFLVGGNCGECVTSSCQLACRCLYALLLPACLQGQCLQGQWSQGLRFTGAAVWTACRHIASPAGGCSALCGEVTRVRRRPLPERCVGAARGGPCLGACLRWRQQSCTAITRLD